MRGLMMDTQLLISSILRHADQNHGEREIVSVTADNPSHRYTYADCFRRTRQLANALGKFGLSPGDRVATLAWNDYRHLECYYAIGGAGYILHTVNPRLFPEQIIFMINHAEDRWIFTDPMFVPLLEKIAEHTPGVEGYRLVHQAREWLTSGAGVICCNLGNDCQIDELIVAVTQSNPFRMK